MAVHRILRDSLVAVSFLLIASSASGQQHCNALLELGLRDIRTEFDQSELDYYLYKRHCKKSSGAWSFDGSGAFGQFSAALGLGQRDAETFCSNQEKRIATVAFNFNYIETFSTQALQAWVRCLELANRKIIIEPLLLPETASFEIWKDAATDSRVQGVLYDPKALLCEGIRSGESIPLSGSGVPTSSSKTMAAGSSFTVGGSQWRTAPARSTPRPS
jgi:hypothetical protein